MFKSVLKFDDQPLMSELKSYLLSVIKMDETFNRMTQVSLKEHRIHVT